MISLLAGAGALATIPAALAAQGPANLPPKWTHKVEQGVDTYVKGGEVLEALVMAQESPAASAADVEAVTTRIFSGLGCRARRQRRATARSRRSGTIARAVSRRGHARLAGIGWRSGWRCRRPKPTRSAWRDG